MTPKEALKFTLIHSIVELSKLHPNMTKNDIDEVLKELITTKKTQVKH